jgi:hypothetical protein
MRVNGRTANSWSTIKDNKIEIEIKRKQRFLNINFYENIPDAKLA